MNEKKKIVVFHPTIAPYRIDLFNSLAKATGCAIYLLMRRFAVFRDYDKIKNSFEFTPKYVFDEGKEHIGSFSFRYWKILDKEKPDSVISFEFGPCPMMVILHRFIKGRNYRIVTMCDDSQDMISNGSLRHKVSRAICSRHVDDIIFSSREVCDWSQAKFGKGLYFPIIRQASPARAVYKSVLPQSNAIAADFNLSDKLVTGFVGRLAKEKNVGALIRSFASSSRSDEKLVIIGDGPERAGLEALSVELGANAIFTGRLEGKDLYSWYNVIDIFVLPSTFEPFGAVVNEALLAGCVSVVSDKCGSRCLIREAENGIVFSLEQKDGLEKALATARQIVHRHGEVITLREDLMTEDFDCLFDNLIRAL